jgi:prepilin-type N-terminal cleavage/methylation domain-containing protein
MNKVLRQKGFTLIEIAIVLVIIGLLLGGVL